MRLFTSALCTTTIAMLLAGCAGNMGSNGTSALGLSPQRTTPISVFDDAAPPRAVSVIHSLMLPNTKTKLPNKGTYVSEFGASSILGYAANNRKNNGPICTVNGVAFVNDVAVDGQDNLMLPNPGNVTGGEALDIHQGPTMCGKLVDSISDPYGQPSDASSPNAFTGQIALGNLVDNGSTPGSLSICTLKGGCTVNLTNGNYFHVGGVAMSNAGDCWIDVKTSPSGGAELVYYKGCAGSGAVASGFKQTYYGGIDIDKSGNLVVIDDMAEDVYIYSGCAPTCTVVGGPFALKGESFFGKLNYANNQFTAVDRTDGVVDVYSYSTKSIKFLYSYSNGLSQSLLPNGVAVNPRSKE